jgi:hypothetical protein
MSTEANSEPSKERESSWVGQREFAGRLLDAIFGEYETTSLPVDSRGVVDCTELALRNGGHGFQIFQQAREHRIRSEAARLERRKRRSQERQQKASSTPPPPTP